MGRELSTYVCEAHKSALKTESNTKEVIYRSYAMNCYFGYNKDYNPYKYYWRDIWLNNLSSRGGADRLLLFAEMAPSQPNADTEHAMDGVVETFIDGYNDGKSNKTKAEILGFNHRVGKQEVAHVVYADGHVDVFHASAMKTGGLSKDQKKGLAYYLCNGYDLPKDRKDWLIP